MAQENIPVDVLRRTVLTLLSVRVRSPTRVEQTTLAMASFHCCQVCQSLFAITRTLRNDSFPPTFPLDGPWFAPELSLYQSL